MPLLYNLIEFLACCLNLVFYILTFETFLEKKADINLIPSALFAIAFLCTTMMPDHILPNIIVSCLSMLWMFFFALYTYHSSIKRKLLTVFLFNIFDIFITNATYFFYQNILNLYVLDSATLNNYDRIYYLFTIYLIQAIVFYIIRRRLQKKEESVSEDYRIPLIFFLCDFWVMVLSHYMLYATSFRPHLVAFFSLLICTLMLICTFLGLLLMKRITRQQQNNRQYALLELQLTEQAKQLRHFQENMEHLHTLRHDMKNYLLNYQTLLKNHQTQEVLTDIERTLKERLELSDKIYTANPLLNSLLLSRESLCKKQQIPLQIHVAIPQDYTDIDIMVAILNLMDNAIEAEQGISIPDRLIIVEILLTSAGLSIIIQNSISSSILNSNDTLTTTKPDPENHGFGLKSVRYMVEKRGGLIDIYEENQIFTVHVLISTA